jgi:preprotein translocase subunit SecF
MSKRILRTKFENMYGKNRPFNDNNKENQKLKNHLDKIIVNNAQGNNYENENKGRRIKNIFNSQKLNKNMNNYQKENNSDNYQKEKQFLPKVRTPETFGVGGALLLLFFIGFLITILYFKDSIIKFFKDFIYSLNFKKHTEKGYKSLESTYNDIITQILQETKLNQQQLQSMNSEFDNSIKIKDKQIEELNRSLLQKEKQEQTIQSEINKGSVSQVNTKINDMCNYKKNTNVLKDGYCYIGYDQNRRECTDVYAGDICMSGQIFPSMAQCQNPDLRL